MILTFPIAKEICGEVPKPSHVINLYDVIVRGLVDKQPPNWLEYLKKHLKQDRILPDAFEEQVNSERPILVGLKLIHYGQENNFILRAAQRMDVTEFDNNPRLKIVYQNIKYLKSVLGIQLSSYLVKKVLFLDKGEIASGKLDPQDWTLPSMANTPLKPYFLKAIDFKKWQEAESSIVPIRSEYLELLQAPKALETSLDSTEVIFPATKPQEEAVASFERHPIKS